MSNHLAEIRQRKGLTQKALALATGISITFLQQIEYGQTKPNIYIAQRLATILGVDVNEIFPPRPIQGTA